MMIFIDEIFEPFYTTVISNIQRYLGKGLGWLTDIVIDRSISISKYNPLAGSSYIKLLKELNHLKNSLINFQNFDDNECFKLDLVRYVHPAAKNFEREIK